MKRIAVVLSLFVSTAALAMPPSSPERADLVTTLQAPATVVPPAEFELYATVRNDGPDPALDVTVSFYSGSGLCEDDHIEKLDVGESRAYTCKGRVLTEHRLYRAAPSIYAHSETPDPNYDNNGQWALVSAITPPDLFVFTNSFPVATPAMSFSMEITAGNVANTPATGVRVTITTPTRFIAVPDFCTVEGNHAVCDLGEVSYSESGPRVFRVEIAAPDESAATTKVEMTIDGNEEDHRPQDDMYSRDTYTYRTFFVTNVEDGGSGSLRAAIEGVNGACGPPDTFPCLIAFRIPQTTAAWHTITPKSPLPRLVRSARIDGTTQRAYYADTNPEGPEVELSGAALTAGNGLELQSDGHVLELAINGFRGSGIVVLDPPWTERRIRVIDGNYIGTDPTGTRAVPNDRGIWIASPGWGVANNIISGNVFAGIFLEKGQTSISLNKIGLDRELRPLGNGASGIGILAGGSGSDVSRNYIGFNHHFGVAIAPDAQNVSVAGNSIQANHQKGIDWGIDGVLTTKPVEIPEITSIRFEEGMTIIDGTSAASGTFAPVITVYANDEPDPSGYGEGQYVLGSVAGYTWRFVWPGDLRGKWVTATATKQYYIGWLRDQRVDTNGDTGWGYYTTTSEFSRAVKAQ